MRRGCTGSRRPAAAAGPRSPVRAVWNSLRARVVFQHPSGDALRRELRGDALRRERCGFDPLRGEAAVPPDSASSHCLEVLLEPGAPLRALFHPLVEQLRPPLPDRGQ